EQLVIWCEKELLWVLGERASTPSLRNQVCRDLSGRLCGLWAQGYLHGAPRKEGYYVKCDQTTMTQIYIDNGWLICEGGVAPNSTSRVRHQVPVTTAAGKPRNQATFVTGQGIDANKNFRVDNLHCQFHYVVAF